MPTPCRVQLGETAGFKPAPRAAATSGRTLVCLGGPSMRRNSTSCSLSIRQEHRGAMSAISRESRSGATTPPDTVGQRHDPGRGRRSANRVVVWHPSRVLVSSPVTGGVAVAQPPANGWQVSGLQSRPHIPARNPVQTLRSVPPRPLPQKWGSDVRDDAASMRVRAYALSALACVLKVMPRRQFSGASGYTPERTTHPLPDAPSTVAGVPSGYFPTTAPQPVNCGPSYQ